MAVRRSARVVFLVALGGVLFGLWFFLAPQQLGGSTGYVTTVGDSMEPVLHDGDLVVVRASSNYQVGDVVAYHSRQLDRVVLHRIVARDGDHYVFKGDHNTWLDSDRPTQDELIGKMQLTLPGVGRRLHIFRTPAAISAAVGLGVLGLLGGRKHIRRRKNRGKDRGKDRATETASGSNGNGRRPDGPGPMGSGNATIAAFSTLAIVALALGLYAFVIPKVVTTHRDAIYDQEGSFSYRSVAKDGRAVYGTDVITTGDPVYLRLAHSVAIAFDYSFQSPSPVDASGTARLVAQVSDVNGWSRTLRLSPTAPFTGQEVTIRGVLDLGALHDMTAYLEKATGVERTQYSVALMPEIEFDGTVAGQPVSETFAPRLDLLIDDFQLQLASAPESFPGEKPVDSLNPTSGGLVTVRGAALRRFSVFGLGVGVEPLRIACLGLELFALIGLLVIMVSRLRAARRGEASLIQARFGRWLVPVRGSATTGGRTVDVESFDSLARLATHYGQVILHEGRNGSDLYLVEDEGVTYRYRARSNGSKVKR